MLTLFNGHGSPISYDMDGWSVNTLNNNGKFGMLYTLTCNAGAFASPEIHNGNQMCINEEYILSFSDRGYVSAIGSSTKSTATSNGELMQYMIDALRYSKLRRIGDLLYYSKARLNYYDGNNKWAKATRYNYNILGDPLLCIKISSEPEIYINEKEILITNIDNSPIITEEDEFAKIVFPIYNGGVILRDDFIINILHIYNGETTIYPLSITNLCSSDILELVINVLGLVGTHYLVFDLDDGNEIKVSFNITNNSMYPIEPLNNLCMANPKHFRFLKNIRTNYDVDYNIKLYENDFNNLLYQSLPSEININELYVD
jgi:hypothetical protein